jgi:hypothetical protein
MLQLELGRDRARRDPDTRLLSAVSNALWLQRDSLEQLLYTLVAEQLILSSGTTRWLVRADADVRGAIQTMQGGELVRAAETAALLADLGLDADASLADIVACVPEPWATLFADHRIALRDLTFEVEGVAAQNRRMLDAGAAAVRETLAGLGSSLTRYDDTGHAVRAGHGSLLLDEQA